MAEAKAKAKKKSTFFGLEWSVVWFALVDIALILLGILNDYILHLIPFPVCLIALLFGGFRCTKDAIEATIKKKKITAGMLVVLSLIGCIYCKEYLSGALVAFMMIIGEVLEDITMMKTKNAVAELIKLVPAKCRKLIDGEFQEVSIKKVRVGDIIQVQAGEKIAVDGIITKGNAAINEASITGESMPVDKKAGDKVFVGTLNENGVIEIETEKLGGDTVLGRIINTVRSAQDDKGNAQKVADKFSEVFLPIVLCCCVIVWFLTHDLLRVMTVLVIACPCALMLATPTVVIAAVGNSAKKGVLIKGGDAIESAAKINAICLDKTGTITSGNMELSLVEGVDRADAEAEKALSRFLGAFDEPSPTLNAIRARIPSGTEAPRAVLPFSSERKKSAATFADGTALIFGAPEYVLGSNCPPSLRERIETLAAEGKRVLVLAAGRGIVSPEALPPVAEIVALVALTDEIRPGAEQTLRYFREQGVELKVISGDNPHTVSRIARQAGLENWEKWVDARTLDTPEALADACDRYTVFGRVSPEQKKALVTALKEKGHNVAMTGDGVNDIPALKTADCSIAMAGGADAARHAAQLTLLNSDFSVMPEIVLEGRRVINNITRAASLFLTKTLFSFFLSILTLLLPSSYPFHPIHLTLISSLTVGIPGFFLALEPCRERIRGNFLRTVLTRALPGGLAVTLCAALAMIMINFGWSRELCSTVAVFAAWFVGFLVLLRTCLPLNRNRAVLLAGVAAAFIGVVLLAGKHFELVPMDGTAWLAAAALCILGGAIVFGTAAFLRRRQKDI